jgi:hypothetical protein
MGAPVESGVFKPVSRTVRWWQKLRVWTIEEPWPEADAALGTSLVNGVE